MKIFKDVLDKLTKEKAIYQEIIERITAGEDPNEFVLWHGNKHNWHKASYIAEQNVKYISVAPKKTWRAYKTLDEAKVAVDRKIISTSTGFIWKVIAVSNTSFITRCGNSYSISEQEFNAFNVPQYIYEDNGQRVGMFE